MVKDIELKIYEILGIKVFKKIILNFRKVILLPFYLLIKDEKLKNQIFNTADNYIMKRGNGLQDLKDFKKKLLSNAIIHIVAIIFSIKILFSLDLFSIILGTFFTILNSYCIMLQRYNHIRINKVINRFQMLEDKKKENIKEELIKNDNSLKPHTYELINKKKKEEIDLEKFLEGASLKELKDLKEYLNKINSDNYYAMYSHLDLEKSKKLKLNFKK